MDNKQDKDTVTNTCKNSLTISDKDVKAVQNTYLKSLSAYDQKMVSEMPYNKFGETWNLVETKMYLRKVSYVMDSIEAKTPSIGLISRLYGTKRIKAYIKMWVIDLVKSTNVKRKPTEGQLDLIAQYIVTDFRNLTISDVYLVFKDVSIGKYGEMFENIDAIKIMGWFTQYAEEKMQAAIMKSENDHSRHSSETRGSVEGSLFQKIGGMSTALNAISSKNKKK